jgi:hypothetical protein
MEPRAVAAHGRRSLYAKMSPIVCSAKATTSTTFPIVAACV